MLQVKIEANLLSCMEKIQKQNAEKMFGKNKVYPEKGKVRLAK